MARRPAHRWTDDLPDHQHAWVLQPAIDEEPPAFACSDCEETTWPCSDCDRPLETAATICARCLQRATDLVDDCEKAYLAIPENARTILGLRAVRYTAIGSPGGAGQLEALPFGIGADEDAVDELAALVPRSKNGTVIHLMREPRNVITVLHEWVDDWADRSKHPVTHQRVFGYLRQHTLWAAQNHPAWHRYLEEVRAVRAKLQALAGTAPVVELAPCVHCGGGRVVRQWGKTGLQDERRCTRCRRTWSDGEEFVEAGRQVLLAMPTTNPDLLVTREVGRQMVPGLSANLLRQVIFKDRRRNDPNHRAYDPTWMPRLPVQWFDGTEELYRLGDVMCVRWSPRTDTPTTTERRRGLGDGLLP